jgi:hypothetical protein
VRPRGISLTAAVPFQDKVTLSDLAGQDPKTHDNDPDKVTLGRAGLLSAKARAPERTRVLQLIRSPARFRARLPALARKLEISEAEIETSSTTSLTGCDLSGWMLKACWSARDVAAGDVGLAGHRSQSRPRNASLPALARLR